jgi:tetratricopeptide (TPR) repeat protein
MPVGMRWAEMKTRSVVFVLALAITLFPAPSLFAQTLTPAYLNDMPTVEKVKAGIKGANELDTNARQAGAFWQLREMMYSFAYSQHRTDRQFTTDEQHRVGEYYTAYYQTWQLVQQAPGQDRGKLFQLQGYTVDPAVKSEILDKLCTPAFRALYLKSTGEQLARIKAQQEADPYRAKPGDVPSAPARSNPPPREAVPPPRQPTPPDKSAPPAKANPPKAPSAGNAPTPAEQFVDQGDKARDAGDPAKAIEAYKKASALDPKLAAAFLGLGYAYMDRGDFQQANAAFKQYVTFAPSDSGGFTMIGLTYEALKQYPQAIEALQTAIRMKPEPGMLEEAYGTLGMVYNDMEKYSEAVAACQQALRLEPENAGANYELGYALFYLKRYPEALAALQQAVRIKQNNANDANSYFYLGLTYLVLGRKSDALDAYNKLLPLDKKQAAELYAEINK